MGRNARTLIGIEKVEEGIPNLDRARMEGEIGGSRPLEGVMSEGGGGAREAILMEVRAEVVSYMVGINHLEQHHFHSRLRQ